MGTSLSDTGLTWQGSPSSPSPRPGGQYLKEGQRGVVQGGFGRSDDCRESIALVRKASPQSPPPCPLPRETGPEPAASAVRCGKLPMRGLVGGWVDLGQSSCEDPRPHLQDAGRAGWKQRAEGPRVRTGDHRPARSPVSGGRSLRGMHGQGWEWHSHKWKGSAGSPRWLLTKSGRSPTERGGRGEQGPSQARPSSGPLWAGPG